jgi:hypothetical protein
MGRVSRLNGEEEKYIQDTGGKARTKGISRKTKTEDNIILIVWIILRWIIER